MADEYEDEAEGGSAAVDAEPEANGLAHFSLKADSVKHLFYAASAIYNGRKDAQAMFTANCKGLKISVENQAKSMLATCMLKKEQFSEFHVEQTRGEMTEIRFKANLAHVLECFAIYGKDALPLTAIHMGYDETEGTLQMLLEESGITSECVLKTTDFGGGDDEATADKDYDAAFSSEPVLAKMELVSSVLHDIVRDLAEVTSADSIRLSLSKQELTLWTSSATCTLEARLPATSDASTAWHVTGAPDAQYSFGYQNVLWAAQLRALANSERSFVRLNARGMLAAVHRLVLDGSDSGLLIKFHVTADEANEDDYVYERVPPEEGGAPLEGDEEEGGAAGEGEEEEGARDENVVGYGDGRNDRYVGGQDDDGLAANAYGLEGGGEEVDGDGGGAAGDDDGTQQQVYYGAGGAHGAHTEASNSGRKRHRAGVSSNHYGSGAGSGASSGGQGSAAGGGGGVDEDDDGYGDMEQYR